MLNEREKEADRKKQETSPQEWQQFQIKGGKIILEY